MPYPGGISPLVTERNWRRRKGILGVADSLSGKQAEVVVQNYGGISPVDRSDCLKLSRMPQIRG